MIGDAYGPCDGDLFAAPQPTERTPAADPTAEALHNAVLAVANTVSNYEDDLRELARTTRGEGKDALTDILAALKAWKAASEAFVNSIR